MKSLVILAIWLAFSSAIYSWIALFFALNRIFFSANENRIVKQNNQSEKLSTGHCALEGVSQLKSNSSQNYTSCTFKFHLQRQLEVSASFTEEKEGLTSSTRDDNWTLMHEVHCFRSDFRTACFFVILEWVFVTWHCFAY